MTAAFSSLQGQILLALPGIGDPRFAQAVIAMCIHGEDGAMGVGIGRVAPRLRLHGLLEQLEIDAGVAPDAPIHLGGPVDPQRGFVLHSPDWSGEDTMAVSPIFAVTTTLDVLRAIADGTGPDRWLVALGYAGWGDGQLDDELRRHGWFMADARDDLLFEVPTAQRWPQAFAGMGVDVRLLSATGGRA